MFFSKSCNSVDRHAIVFVGGRSTANQSSIFLIAGSLMVLLLLVFESVELACRWSRDGIWFVIGWLRLIFIWL